MAWVKDPGVARLFVQLDAMAPNRSRASDGTKGDASHTTGEHVPEMPAPPGNPPEEVDAGDYTHDPQHGCDIGQVFESIRLSRDPRVYYMIFNKRICSSYANPGAGRAAWEWGPYSNAANEPHDRHGHLSVLDNPRHGGDWAIGTPKGSDMHWYASAAREGHPNTKLWFGSLEYRELVDAAHRTTIRQTAIVEGLGQVKVDASNNPLIRGNCDGMGPVRGRPASADDIAAALLPGLTAALVDAMPDSVLTMAEAEMACANALGRVRFELS